MKDRLMIYRTCAAGYRRRLYEDKTRLSKGVPDLERVVVNSMITSIGFKENTRKVSIVKMTIKRYLVNVCEDNGITAGNQNRWRHPSPAKG
jgi:hypothetical protein